MFSATCWKVGLAAHGAYGVAAAVAYVAVDQHADLVLGDGDHAGTGIVGDGPRQGSDQGVSGRDGASSGDRGRSGH